MVMPVDALLLAYRGAIYKHSLPLSRSFSSCLARTQYNETSTQLVDLKDEHSQHEQYSCIRLVRYTTVNSYS
jgi:hypothetical protein